MLNSCGIWYAGADSNWTIFDETQAVFDTNWAFNVLEPTTNGNPGWHQVTPGNLFFNYTLIDNPLLNNNPSAVFFLTKTWEFGVYDVAHGGVWYSQGDSKWTIYNEDNLGTLQLNSSYNYFIPDAGSTFFKHVATSDNYITVIDHPLLNGNPNARILVLHDYTNSPGQMGYINSEIGVWYDGNNWTIYTEDTSPLFIGATFNVLVMNESSIFIGDNGKSAEKMTAFPNPAGDQLSLNFALDQPESLSIQVYNSIGRRVKTIGPINYPAGVQTVKLDVTEFPLGNYVCNLLSERHSQVVKFSVFR